MIAFECSELYCVRPYPDQISASSSYFETTFLSYDRLKKLGEVDNKDRMPDVICTTYESCQHLSLLLKNPFWVVKVNQS